MFEVDGILASTGVLKQSRVDLFVRELTEHTISSKSPSCFGPQAFTKLLVSISGEQIQIMSNNAHVMSRTKIYSPFNCRLVYKFCKCVDEKWSALWGNYLKTQWVSIWEVHELQQCFIVGIFFSYVLSSFYLIYILLWS